MKTVLSQTIFANVATLPKEAMTDAIVPTLRILNKGEYPENDFPVTDFDSNGWPQTGRNNAIETIRKGFSFHLAGDQHLGSTIQYGTDEFGDSGYAFCVPSISNYWPRRWYPINGGANRKEDSPKYTGDFKDGFGNKFSVKAISNPLYTNKKQPELNDRAAGYGIVRFNKNNRTVKIECWPRDANPEKGDSQQYQGWPITINQEDNYGKKAFSYLPKLRVQDAINPVVQIIDENGDQIIYTIRIRGNSFTPKLFEPSLYTIKVSDPSKGLLKEFNHIDSQKPNIKELTVNLN